MSTIIPGLSGMTAAPTATDREKLSATAKQFEALFVREMLSAARKTDFGGDKLFGGQALDTFRQLQDEHFADVTAQKGVLGMAQLIEAQMQRYLPAEATSPANPGANPGANPSANPGKEG